MFSDFLVNVLSYPYVKTGKVIKGPYLLAVPTSDFGLISSEIGNKMVTNLDITTVEITDNLEPVPITMDQTTAQVEKSISLIFCL